MSLVKKIVLMTLCLMATTVLFNLIGWTLGYQGFLIVGEIELNPLFINILFFLLVSVQTSVLASITWNMYGWKPLLYLLPYFILDFVLGIFIYQSSLFSIYTFVLPILYILVLAFLLNKTEKCYKVLARLLVVILIICLYQGLTIYFKTGRFELGYNNVSAYVLLIYSIDLTLLYVVIYCYGGMKNVLEQMGKSLFPVQQWDAKVCQESVELDKWYNSLSIIKKAKAISFLLLLQILQWAFILFVCRLGNVLIEGLAITGSFLAYGLIIQKKWHSKCILICTVISSLMFYGAARMTLAYQYSQFMPILIGLFLLYALYRIAIYTEECNQLKAIPPFHVRKADEKAFYERGIQCGIKNEDIEVSYRYFRCGVTAKELAAELGYSKSYVEKKMSTIKKKMHENT